MFFHEQDTERLVEERATFLNYGVFLDAWMPEVVWDALSDDEKSETYGRFATALMDVEVIPMLKRHGIEVEWDHDMATRILLRDVDFYCPL